MTITRKDKFLLFLILTLFIIGGYLDEAPPSDTQKAPVVTQEVLRSATPVYNFPSYRVEEPKPAPTKAIKKKTANKKVYSHGKDVSRGGESRIYTVTAYCTGSINAIGNKPTIGTIAAPRDIPLGTKVKINNKIYTVEDRTNIRYDKGLGNTETRFDIYMGKDEFNKCYSWGKKVLKVEVLK